MKRLLTALLFLMMIVAAIFALSSCELSGETGNSDAEIAELRALIEQKDKDYQKEFADLASKLEGTEQTLLAKIGENTAALGTLREEYDAKVAELAAADAKNAADLAALTKTYEEKVVAIEKAAADDKAALDALKKEYDAKVAELAAADDKNAEDLAALTKTYEEKLAALEKAIKALEGGTPVAPDLPKSGVGECGLAYITYDGATCTVTGIGSYGQTDLVVPEKIDGYTVRAIANEAFVGTEITSLTLPDTLATIGACAFSGCNALTEIGIPASVGTVGEGAFADCASLDTVTIPTWAFSAVDFRYIKHLTVNGGTTVQTITSNGEVENTVLETLVFGPSVRTISSYAFYECTSLTSVVIPEGVTEIGMYAFGGCTSLTSVVIPEGVTEIGRGAFEYCTSLTIYCKAASKPSGWDSWWNDSDRPVVWGYTGA